MIIYLIKRIYLVPRFIAYYTYDKAMYIYFNLSQLFEGWGIHLFTGKFGQGKTSLMVEKAYNLCVKYPQLTILTNINLSNFPSYTKILKLNNVNDILKSPNNCLCLIDEIGTLFNSRDFCNGSNSVPKPLFQHLCQCRKKRIMIYATVQRFNLLDKQIRDISATVTACSTSFAHPFSRLMIGHKYDIDEYEKYNANRTYEPVYDKIECFIQSNRTRKLYNTTELVSDFLKMEFLSDEEILANQADTSVTYAPLDRKQKKQMKKSVTW